MVPARAGVFRRARPPDSAGVRGPRASGGVPETTTMAQAIQEWSPRERGCSAAGRFGGGGGGVVPARAGVFRHMVRVGEMSTGGPRASGGVPLVRVSLQLLQEWSPRERGCSVTMTKAQQLKTVVPARAGVFRRPWTALSPSPGGPRASGGVPWALNLGADGLEWSPRERGCSVSSELCHDFVTVVPARAGVFRPRSARRRPRPGGPRASGGVPVRGNEPSRW